MIVVFVAARNDWSLLGGVQHHVQTSQARSPGYWCHPLVAIHSAEVNGLINNILLFISCCVENDELKADTAEADY